MFIKVPLKSALFLTLSVPLAVDASAAIPCDSVISFRITYEVEKARQSCGDNCDQVRKDTAKQLGCTTDGTGLISVPRKTDGNQLSTYEGASNVDRIGAGATAQAQDILAKAQAANEKAQREIQADVENRIRKAGFGFLLGDAPRGTNPSGGGTISASGGGAAGATAGAGGGGYGGPSLSGISGFPAMPTKELIPDAIALAKAQADWRLAKAAAQASANGRIFPRAEAEKAHDPEIRKQLVNLSITQTAKADLKVESARLTTQFGELAGLALETQKRSKAIDSIPNGAGLILADAKGNVAGAKVQSTSEPKPEPANVKETTSPSTELEKAVLSTSSKAVPSSEPPLSPEEEKMNPEERVRYRQARLRDLLRTRLNGEEKNVKGVLADTFEGKLARETVSSSTDTEAQDGGNILSGAFTAAKNAAFAMSTAETEAEVKRLLRESQRELASLAAGGILDTESPALFARVSLAHRRCQEHRCVR